MIQTTGAAQENHGTRNEHGDREKLLVGWLFGWLDWRIAQSEHDSARYTALNNNLKFSNEHFGFYMFHLKKR